MDRRTLALICCIVAVTGCGGVQRESLEGVVTLDGQPLQNGYITFQPQSDTRGPTAGAQIDSGKFAIPASKGTFAGHFRVEIISTRLSGRTIADRDGTLVPAKEQFLPKKYNVQSNLEVQVNPNELNQFTFELTLR